MNGIYILLGSNMGNRLEYLRETTQLLIQKGIRILDESSVYETEPWGNKDQGWFLNVILQIETSKEPVALLEDLLDTEQILGRIRKKKWGERCIDIDLLYYHDRIMKTKNLVIPHVGITKRSFTLIPLVEMCPWGVHPNTGETHVQMLANCDDELDCILTDYQL